MTRHERRLAEREALKHPSTKSSGGLSRSSLLPIVLIAAVGIGAIIWAIAHGSSTAATTAGTSGSANAPLVTPVAYDPKPSMLPLGSVAPNFSVRDAAGDAYTLAESRGHPVVLEFFATWCTHCHHEAPVIHKLAAAYGPKNVSFMAIVANPYGPAYEATNGKDTSLVTANDLKYYRQTYKADYPLFYESNFKAANRYGANSYPTIYVIDKSGKVAFHTQGEIPYATLAKVLDRTLK